MLHSKEETLTFLASEKRVFTALDVGSWQIGVFWAASHGDFELAEEMMDEGLRYDEQNGVLNTGWLNYPVLEPLHNSAPYKRLIKRINLEEFWRTNGFPKNCRPLGEDDFVCN